jgi:HAD superfamily hydrolase (TIGR01459 family)
MNDGPRPPAERLHSPPSAGEDEAGRVAGLAALAPLYDLLLCDVWGVLHNGLVAFPAASDALIRYRDGGGHVLLISNAPRPGGAVARQLDRLGAPRSAYDAIVTSGDITRAAVAERRGQIVHHLGPPRDHAIFDGLDVRFGDIEAAGYVVCSGFDDDERETVEDYRDRLERMRRRDLWMVCANPDLVVERGERLVPCAGALAQAYEALGGAVLWAGKPHRPVYEAALASATRLRGGEPVARGRTLAIGDAIRTDIAGAAACGFDTLFIARGIHSAELGLETGPLAPARLNAWLARQAVRPNAVAETLTWE